MCMFATVLFPAFCLENKDMYIQRFSAISVIDCKSVFGFVTKPGAPPGINDKRCAIDVAIFRGCLRRMGSDSLLVTDGLDALRCTDQRQSRSR